MVVVLLKDAGSSKTGDNTMELNLFDNPVGKFDKYMQLPFKDNILSRAYLPNPRTRYTSHYLEYNVRPIEDLFDFIDSDSITEILCQKPVTDLVEAMNEYNNEIKHIIHWMYRKDMIEDESFQLDVTKNFGWKRGTYPFILKMIDYFEGRYMRAAGMESLFKRRIGSEGYLNSHRSRLNKLDRLRATAKSMVGSKEADAEQYTERMNLVLSTLMENTELGNSIDSRIKYKHFFTIDEYNSEDPYTFLDMSFITIIEIDSMDMWFLHSGKPAFKITQPPLITYYARPLYKVLNGEKRFGSHLMGYSQSKHAYLQDYSLWMKEASQSSFFNGSPWSSVCLSSHNDDVIGNLNRHKYSDAAFALTQWGSSYNMDTTNPYNSPNHLIYQQGLSKEMMKLDTLEFRTLVNFHYEDCFKQRSDRHRRVALEENPELVDITNRIDSFTRSRQELWGYHLIDECKDCPFIEDCARMQHQIRYEKLRNSEFSCILEQLTAEEHLWCGAECSSQGLYIYWMHHLSMITNKVNDEEIYEYIDYNLDELGYYQEPLTAEEQAVEDARIAQQRVQSEMEQWAIGANNGR